MHRSHRRGPRCPVEQAELPDHFTAAEFGHRFTHVAIGHDTGIVGIITPELETLIPWRWRRSTARCWATS